MIVNNTPSRTFCNKLKNSNRFAFSPYRFYKHHAYLQKNMLAAAEHGSWQIARIVYLFHDPGRQFRKTHGLRIIPQTTPGLVESLKNSFVQSFFTEKTGIICAQSDLLLSGNPARHDQFHDISRISGQGGYPAPVNNDQVAGKII